MTQSGRTKFLFVDDRRDNLMVLRAIADGQDYECFEALSGVEAIELNREHQFAAILLDVQMPVMDGFEAAKRIRRDRPEIPIIFLTAIYRDEHFEGMGYLAGAVDYIFKPVSPEILKAKLSVFAELFRKSEENLRQAELLKQAALRQQEQLFLRAAVEARDEFLSIAAHELKTPITPLNLQMEAFLKMFRDGSFERVERERLIRMLETSKGQVDRLWRLINDLVDVSQIKSGRFKLRPEQMDLSELVQDVALAFVEQAKQAQCELRVKCRAPFIGDWDRFRLEQVTVNLLTNAIKYGAGRPIDMIVEGEDTTVTLTVQDRGIGIAPEDHARIFERFERAVSPLFYGGLGLGLFISRQIVERHGGYIGVASRLGEGSRFFVTLPRLQRP